MKVQGFVITTEKQRRYLCIGAMDADAQEFYLSEKIHLGVGSALMKLHLW